MKLNLIAAASMPELGIGNKGQLPWRLKEEMKYFTRMTIGDGTKKNAVIMGRKTWISIPEKWRPLNDRLNVILSRQEGYDPKTEIPPEANKDDVIGFKSLDEAIQALSERDDINPTLWIGGGSAIYKEAMDSKFCHRIYLTEIQKSFESDTFFPDFDRGKFQEVTDPEVPQEEQKEKDLTYFFKVYEKI